MKKFVAVVGLLMAVVGSASAQGGGGGGGGRAQMSPEVRDSTTLARAFNGITLNADQTAKAKTVIVTAREALPRSTVRLLTLPRRWAPRTTRVTRI